MKLKSGIFALITLAILASCSTSNDVVSGRGIIQKRKYNDGFYISLGKNYDKKTDKRSSEEEIILSEETAEISLAEETITAENSTTQTQFTETENTPEIITPSQQTDFSEKILEEEITTGENTLSTSTEVIEEKNESFKPDRKYATKMIKAKVSDRNAASADAMLILMIILCFIIPPLAVFLFEGASSRFWIDLILFIIGIAVVGWLLSGLAGLALLISVIYALLIVLSVI